MKPAIKLRSSAIPSETGTVIAAHGRHYLVQCGEQKLQCVTRGKKGDVAVGDVLQFQRTSPNCHPIRCAVSYRASATRSACF